MPSADSGAERARGDFAAGYDMGRRHGYEIATTELLRILNERMKAGDDILPLLPLVDELRSREYRVLPPEDQEGGAKRA